MTTKYTHDQLIKRAINWLWGQGCVIVISGMAGGSQEPDAIGFCHTYSILIECKASRSDFLRDKHKRHHRAGQSMGNKRYYLAPQGMINPEELPEKWGLIEPREQNMRIIGKAEWFMDKSSHPEISLLVSAIRRIKGMMPQGVSVKSYYHQTNNKATLGIERVA
ncbi:hypothetical protein ES703_73363 [subsurface metagenome]